MKPSKYALFSALLCLFVFTIVGYTSCKKDEDRDPCRLMTCYNGGTCSMGVCSCPTGYDGTSCETVSRVRFLGNWTASDRSNAPLSAYTYMTAIEPQTVGVTGITIESTFCDGFFKKSISATVSGRTIAIAKQKPDGTKYSVEGTGTFTLENKIEWNYTITNDSTAQATVYHGTWH